MITQEPTSPQSPVVYEYAEKEIAGSNWTPIANQMSEQGWELMSTERSSRGYSLYSVPLYGPTRYRTTVMKFRRPKPAGIICQKDVKP
jgi:hypothetical protein